MIRHTQFKEVKEVKITNELTNKQLGNSEL